MATLFPLPSLADCVQFARNAYRSYLPGSNAWLWPNNIGPSAKVVGGSSFEIYQRLDYVGKQAFVLFAEGKYLDDHASQYGLSRKQPAPAKGNVVFTASDAIAVDNSAQFERGDGVIVSASAAASLAGAGTLTVPVIANVAAAAGNTQPGAPLTILSGVTGPGASTATVVVDPSGLQGGLDQEPDGPPRSSSLSCLRGRILWRLRNPPQGGAPADYVAWATAVPGVTRAFVERCWLGPGTVRVFPIFDELFAAQGGVAPQDYIDTVIDALAAEIPSAAQVTIVAPQAQYIGVTISGLNPVTGPVEAAISAELADAFMRLGRVSGGDTGPGAMDFIAAPFTFSDSWIWQAIADSTGVNRSVLVAPGADVPIANGSLPVFGALTFE